MPALLISCRTIEFLKMFCLAVMIELLSFRVLLRNLVVLDVYHISSGLLHVLSVISSISCHYEYEPKLKISTGISVEKFGDVSSRMPHTTQPLLLQSHKASLPEPALRRLIQRTHHALQSLQGSIAQVSENVYPGILLQEHRQCL